MNIKILEMHDGEFSSEQMKEFFDEVKDKSHWKNPIDVCVVKSCIGLAQASICHYHGCIPECYFDREDDFGIKWFRIESPGYMCD